MATLLERPKNFGIVTINGLGGLTASQTSITLASGEGGKLDAFPGTAYKMVIWNNIDYPNGPMSYPNRELVKVTDRSGDALTVVRGQGGTPGFAHPAGKILMMMVVQDEDLIYAIESRIGPFFRAVRSGGADQTAIAANTDTKVLFNAEDFDLTGEFDTTNNRYVADRVRRITVKSQFRFLGISAAGKLCQCRIYKNGALYSVYEVLSPAAGDIFVSHSDSLTLVATDFVEIFARHNDVAARDIDGDVTLCFFTVE